MTISPIKIGSYINYTTRHVETELSGARRYIQRKHTGKVVSIDSSTMSKIYKVKLRSKKHYEEYHQIPRYKITHVWYTV